MSDVIRGTNPRTGEKLDVCFGETSDFPFIIVDGKVHEGEEGAVHMEVARDMLADGVRGSEKIREALSSGLEFFYKAAAKEGWILGRVWEEIDIISFWGAPAKSDVLLAVNEFSHEVGNPMIFIRNLKGNGLRTGRFYSVENYPDRKSGSVSKATIAAMKAHLQQHLDTEEQGIMTARRDADVGSRRQGSMAARQGFNSSAQMMAMARTSESMVRACAHCERELNLTPKAGTSHGTCRRHFIQDLVQLMSSEEAEARAVDVETRNENPWCPDLKTAENLVSLLLGDEDGQVYI